MFKKYSANEAELRILIRQIIKEELTNHFNQPTEPELDEFLETHEPIKAERPVQKPSSSIPSECSNRDNDSPWVIFGTPIPDPDQTPSISKRERPRALPGWSEPYSPDFDGFDPPPYLAKKIRYR